MEAQIPEKDKESGKVKTVGKYKLGRVLGTGSFGEVRHAVCTETGKEVAVKCIDKQKLNDKGFEQLQREIAIMAKLRHPNVVTFITSLKSSSRFYLVMEYVEGGELFSYIKPYQGVKESTARRYFKQLLEAVYYCHQQQIVHRDLKPENLLVTKDGTLKVSDFGLSNVQLTKDGTVSDSLKLQTLCGTPYYVAPEVLMKGGYSGFRADIWSCGVILFVMLHGKLPFEGNTAAELGYKIVKGNYEMGNTASPPAQDVIKKILVVNPDKRIQLPALLKHPWVANPTPSESAAAAPTSGDEKPADPTKKKSLMSGLSSFLTGKRSMAKAEAPC